jgi:ABC-type transporter Mla maintaining outer membrane lipid asymmetry permease subunit MlaE
MGIEPPHSVPPPGVAERAFDTATDVSRTIQEVTETLRLAVNRLRATVDRAQRQRQPLAQLRAVTREAPLTGLFIAFLLGVAFTRRR